MVQLLLHLFGDFIIQNDWMALKKKENSFKGYLTCLIHCLLYSLPFFLVTGLNGVSLIFLTHFIIDKYHVIEWFLAVRNNAREEGKLTIKNFGYGLQRPFAISIWLMIITDNTIHLILNYLFIKYVH